MNWAAALKPPQHPDGVNLGFSLIVGSSVPVLVYLRSRLHRLGSKNEVCQDLEATPSDLSLLRPSEVSSPLNKSDHLHVIINI